MKLSQERNRSGDRLGCYCVKERVLSVVCIYAHVLLLLLLGSALLGHSKSHSIPR